MAGVGAALIVLGTLAAVIPAVGPPLGGLTHRAGDAVEGATREAPRGG